MAGDTTTSNHLRRRLCRRYLGDQSNVERSQHECERQEEKWPSANPSLARLAPQPTSARRRSPRLSKSEADTPSRRTSLLGSSRPHEYPAASGPWADPVRVPDEPLIDATDCGVTVVEAVGDAHEVEASLAQSVAAPAASSGSQSTEVHLLPSSDGERKLVAGLSNESGGPATTSIEERLARSYQRSRCLRPAPPKRKESLAMGWFGRSDCYDGPIEAVS